MPVPPQRSPRARRHGPRRVALAVCLVSAAALTACSRGSSGAAPTAPSPAAVASPSAGSAAPSLSPPVAPALEPVTISVPEGMDGAPFDTERSLMAPPGWAVSVLARVDGARHMAWAPDGRLLVSVPKAGEVVAVTPAADGASAASTDVLLEGLRQPHGLAFDGDTLYVAESDRLDAYAWADGEAGGRVTVVDDLPNEKSPDLKGAYAHALKSLALGDDGALYVTVGSTGNVSAEDREASPERAVVLRVPKGTRDADAKDVEVFAHGVRNGTALAVAPDGEAWTAVNNRDNIAYPFHRSFDESARGEGGDDFGETIPDYVDDHPMEPLAHLTAGRDLGWPYCNPDPSVDLGVAGSELVYASPPFVRDADSNADGDALDCASLPRIEEGLPAHSAPLGMTFADVPGYGAGALVAAHGSWNRQPPQPPYVSFFPYADGRMGTRQDVLTGWQDTGGERFGRPVDVVTGPDGALYVSDDAAGTVYRVVPAP